MVGEKWGWEAKWSQQQVLQTLEQAWVAAVKAVTAATAREEALVCLASFLEQTVPETWEDQEEVLGLKRQCRFVPSRTLPFPGLLLLVKYW